MALFSMWFNRNKYLYIITTCYTNGKKNVEFVSIGGFVLVNTACDNCDFTLLFWSLKNNIYQETS